MDGDLTGQRKHAAESEAHAAKLDVGLEAAADVWEEIQPLLDEHWREIAFFDDIPLLPNKVAYFAMQNAGKLRVFTARDAGRLVGYAVFTVDFAVHYSTSLQAIQDVLFLLPAYRNAGNGGQLISYCDHVLRGEGVQCVIQHVKRAHDFGPLLSVLGYEPIETIYVKRLDHGN